MLGLWLGLGRRGEDEAPPSSEEESSRPGEELKSTAISGLEGGPVGFAQAASAGGACHFGRGAISGGGFEVGARAFEAGIMTQPLAFRAWPPWSGAFETHSRIARSGPPRSLLASLLPLVPQRSSPG